ncbi:molybdenum cofactor synthesis domain-containing protein [Deinobacterium chartae]|uniref:Molybdenum cofactor synthesis domain-containing protein n=1 Tax=Deinobacterium chartae TaxID=521158 RepID=A0A841I4Z4_9DEIO|nr:molybdopterin-binding protein [Deinobacterium chartae]MBB6098955.1 molybdenum cofactor synthesis domain-containing protein [Deinobacterium chartae]
MTSVSVLMVTASGAPDPALEASARALEARFSGKDLALEECATIPDEAALIRRALRQGADQRGFGLILTLGGTGLGPRSRVPEATAELLDRPLPGIAELIRLSTLQKSRLAALSRGVAGLRGKTLIVNLGAGEGAAVTGFDAIAPLLPFVYEDRLNSWV